MGTMARTLPPCSECSNTGIKGASSDLNLGAIPDEEVAKMPFCGCPKGQSVKGLYTRRIEGWRQFILESRAKSEANRQKAQEQVIDTAIPERFADATLASFAPFSVDPEKKEAYNAAVTLTRNDGWIMNGANMRKFGLTISGESSGIGKTFLATGIYRILTRGRTGAWISYPDLCQKAVEGYDGPVHKMRNIAEGVDVLLLDDLGKTESGAPTDYIVKLIDAIISCRHLHNKITLITTNRNKPQIVGMFGNPTFQRIAELTKAVTMGGKIIRDLK